MSITPGQKREPFVWELSVEIKYGGERVCSRKEKFFHRGVVMATTKDNDLDKVLSHAAGAIAREAMRDALFKMSLP